MDTTNNIIDYTTAAKVSLFCSGAGWMLVHQLCVVGAPLAFATHNNNEWLVAVFPSCQCIFFYILPPLCKTISDLFISILVYIISLSY